MGRIIVAWDDTYGIGRGSTNALAWAYPRDMKHFSHMTKGHRVLMGWKTYQSMGKNVLSKRDNVIVSRAFNSDNLYKNEDNVTIFTPSLTKFLTADTWIIGGGQVYKQMLELGLVSEIYASHVKGDYGADIKFPIDLIDDDWSIRQQDVFDDGLLTITQYVKKSNANLPHA